MLRRRRDHRYHKRRPHKEIANELERLLAMFGMKHLPAGGKGLADFGPRTALERDEAPWRELAMIRHTHGQRQHLIQLRCTGAWAGHGLGGGRLAAAQEGQKGRCIVELGHGAH